jgi:hypothetical protein
MMGAFPSRKRSGRALRDKFARLRQGLFLLQSLTQSNHNDYCAIFKFSLLLLNVNFTRVALQFILLVTTLLLAMSWLPSVNIFGFQTKEISVLADLNAPVIDSLTTQADSVKNQADTTLTDTLAFANVPAAERLPCPKGVTCIEDFSEKQNALAHLAQAITELQNQKRKKVRIAWFGDSFSEGDMITGALRDSLQREYGGQGVGFMPITSPSAKVRPTITHTFSNWKTYSILDKSHSPVPYGFCGQTFFPLGTSTVNYGGVDFLGGAPVFDVVRFFYSDAKQGASVGVSLDNATAQNAKVVLDTNKLHVISVAATGVKDIAATFKGKMRVYGASMEADYGIYIDNFALRGNAGSQLQFIDKKLLMQIQQLQNYDLVVLQYGLNVTFTSIKDYSFYEKDMLPIVQMMQTCFPKSSFLLLGTSDRSTHDARGNLVSYPAINTLTDAQRNIAKTCGIAFWDTRKAMGSTGGMSAWRSRNHASADYTHLSWAGGKAMAHLFYKALGAELKNH